MIEVHGQKYFCAKEWAPYHGSFGRRKALKAVSELHDSLTPGYALLPQEVDRGRKKGHGSLGLYEQNGGYSLEASIAACSDADGFYLIEVTDPSKSVVDEEDFVEEDSVAMVIIEGGMVHSGSGLIGPISDIRREVESRQATVYFGDNELPIFCSTTDIADHFDDAQIVILQEILDGDCRVPVHACQRSQGTSPAKALMAVGIFLGGMGSMGYYVYANYFAPEPEYVGMSAEELLEQKRQQFMVDQRTQASQVVPVNNTWASDSLQLALNRHGVNGYGWLLDQVECTVAKGCTMYWRTQEGAPAPIEPMAELLEVDPEQMNVTVTDVGVLTYHVSDLPLPEYEQYDDQRIENAAFANSLPREWWELKQLQKIRIPGVDIKSPQDMKKIVALPSPQDVPALYAGRVIAEGSSIAEMEALYGLLEQIPARIDRVRYATGAFNLKGWEIEVRYVRQN